MKKAKSLRPKRRIPLPGKTEKAFRDKTAYTRKPKHGKIVGGEP
jgi:hypothetical protein